MVGHEEKLFDLTQYFHGSVCEIKTYNIFYACPSRTEQNDPLTNPTQWLFLSAIFDVSCYNTARWKMAVFIFQIASDYPFQFPLCCILLTQTHHNKYTGPTLLFPHYFQNVVNNLIIKTNKIYTCRYFEQLSLFSPTLQRLI